MKKLLGLLVVALALVGCTTNEEPEEVEEVVVETPHVDAVPQMNLEEYEAYLADGNSGIVYFGWITRCGDSTNFQENYLEQLLIDHPELDGNFYIVDLDNEAPDALIDKELREPLKEKYNVEFSPTLLLIEDGQIADKIEWTLKESDAETAIARDILDGFFNDSGYLN